MKMGKNDPRQDMSKSTKGSGNSNMKGGAPDEVCGPGSYSTPKKVGGKGPAPDPVSDSKRDRALEG